MFSVVFVFQVFRPLKVLQKFRKNYIKNQRPGSLRNHQGREGGTTGTPEGSLAWPNPWPRQAPSWLPCAPPGAPFGPIFTPVEETLIPEPFFLEAIPIYAA